jgi:uncharacterized cupin superfamily protein
MTTRRHPNVVNVDELDASDITKLEQGKHHAIDRTLGHTAGSKALGGTVMEIPPGAVAYPFHFHTNNEEAIYVLSGTGTTRIGDARVKVRAGDWIAYPPGPAHAHQMLNDGVEPLVYLCISTQHDCEVVGYPDSNKILARGGPFENAWIRQVVKRGPSIGYWDDEPDA